MTEAFQSIKIEAYLVDTWTDISADVMQSPEPSWNIGIMGNGSVDRLGDAELFTFTLKNGETNSNGLIGYYSPENQNCRAGWGVGTPVRLSFQYEDRTYYKFYGLVAPDGIDTKPGLYGQKTVSVTAEGFIALADRHIVELLTLETDLTVNQAVPLVLANMPIQPLAIEYGNPVYTFPTVFDAIGASTSASQVLNDLAMSEWGYIYTKGDTTGGQTLVIEGKSDRINIQNTAIPVASASSGFLLLETGDYLLLETDDKLILEIAETVDFDEAAYKDGVKIDYGANLANYITGTSYPREIDAAATTVLFQTQRRIFVEAGQTLSNIRGRYRDPNGGSSYINGTDMVTPVSGTDYEASANEDGTGADYTANISIVATYGTEQVDYEITNAGGAGAWVWIQARGKGIYKYDPITKIFADTTSIDTYGKYPLSVDMPYQDDPLVIDSVCGQLLTLEKEPYSTIKGYPLFANESIQDMFAFLVLEPGTRARFAETVTGYDRNAFINGYSARIVAGKYVVWSPVLKTADDTEYWKLDEGELDNNTALDT